MADGSDICVACALELSLETPTSPSAGNHGAEIEGKRVGPYLLRRLIGEGGMGHVYEAMQEEPVRRRVALKSLKAGMDSAQILARFESEKQALALMSHPNIAQAYDAGVAEDGRPYVAMEFVDGPWITDYCDHERLGIRERLDMFLEICRGVAHAHQKGVIHRDLKPSNILVHSADGRATPKIIDFGIAKAIGAELGANRHFTRIGQLVGTLDYMSPEQAGPASHDVDTRTDVYALGVLLYELLTGKLPFEARRGDEASLRRKISEEDAPTCVTRLGAVGVELTSIARARATTPTSLLKDLRGDLEWILAKTLERDRTRRYGSPAELAADIVRHLNHEPVVAGPPSASYRASKFVRRHRASVTAAVVALAALISFAVVLSVNARRIAEEREAADQTARFLSEILSGVRPGRLGKALIQELRDAVAATRPNGGDGETLALESAIAELKPTDVARRLVDRQFLIPAAERIERDLSSRPLVAGRLEDALGEAYLSIGLLPAAEIHAKRAIAIRTAASGADHPSVLSSEISLVNIYFQQGKYQDAETQGLKTLEARRRVLGPYEQNVVLLENSLGNIYVVQGRWAEAKKYYEAALEGLDHFPTTNPAQRLMTLSNLVIVYDQMGDLDRAEKTALEILEKGRAALGPDDSLVTSNLDNLANVYLRQKRYEEAVKTHREALEARRKMLGSEHPDTLVTMHNLCSDLEAFGTLDEAEALLVQLLEIRRRVLPADHPFTAGTVYTLANVRRKQNRLDEAERLYREAYETRRRTLPPGNVETLDTMIALGCVAAVRGDHAHALSWLSDAVEQGYRDREGVVALSANTDLNSLHGDPVFEALAAKAKASR